MSPWFHLSAGIEISRLEVHIQQQQKRKKQNKKTQMPPLPKQTNLPAPIPKCQEEGHPGKEYFRQENEKKGIGFCGRDYLWLWNQPREMKNHLGQLKLQDLGKKIFRRTMWHPPKNWLNLEKSTDGEKIEEEKCSFVFCCWSLCICSLYCSKPGTTIF